MGSQHDPDGGLPTLPTIILDRTLAELYDSASPRTAGKCIGQVLGGINSITGIGLDVPRNAKYLYQDKAFNTTLDDSPATPGSEARVRADLSMKYLSLIPQRDAFISGATPVVFFRTGRGPNPGRLGHDTAEIDATISALDPSQRPRVVLCESPDRIPVREHGIDLLACKLMLDGLEAYPLVVPPDTHWLINSKAALATSGLPTPRSDVLDITGHAPPGPSCCEPCLNASSVPDHAHLVPTTCTGARNAWLNAQSAHLCAAIASRPLPFVLKNQQTFGGAGTFLVRTEDERASVLTDLRDGGVLRRLLSCVTPRNAHLRPAALVFSDVVERPVGDYGVTFFVREGKPPLFLAASEQMIADGSAWVGSSIDYGRQEALEQKFGALVGEVAAWLRGHGYVGPAGADVLETKGGDEVENGAGGGEMGRYHVVDLNVRTSGSLCLPLMRTHFTSRGLWSASSFSISLKRSREDFMREFRGEFEGGSMCVLSWSQDPETGLSMADVAVGAADAAALEVAMKRVRDATDEVIF